MAARRDEDALQIGVVSLLLRCGYWPVHVPNQGWRSRIAGAVLKLMGLWPGFPDLIVFNRVHLIAAGGKQIVCTIELKRPPRPLKRGGFEKPKAPRAEQIDTHARLAERGVPNIVAHSIDQVLSGMAALGAPLNARV
jgi:hypothetical protein